MTVTKNFGGLDPRDWRVRGNDTDDDSAAFQAFLDDIPAHSVVQMPPNFMCRVQGAGFTLTKPITIQGWGRNSGFHMNDTAVEKKVFEVKADDCSFRNLLFRGDATVAADYQLYNRAISMNNRFEVRRSGLEVRECEFTQFGGYAVGAEFADRVTVADNYIHDTIYGGVRILSTFDYDIKDNRIGGIVPRPGNGNCYGIGQTRYESDDQVADPRAKGGRITGNYLWDIDWTGIDSHATQDMIIANNEIRTKGYAIGMKSGGGVAFDPGWGHFNVIIDGNMCISPVTDGTANDGILITGPSGVPAPNGQQSHTVNVTNNVVVGHGLRANYRGAGIFVRDAYGVNVSNNNLRGNSANGIYWDVDSESFVGSGNIIRETWRATTLNTSIGEPSGFRSDDRDQSGVVLGNMIEANDEPTIPIGTTWGTAGVDEWTRVGLNVRSRPGAFATSAFSVAANQARNVDYNRLGNTLANEGNRAVNPFGSLNDSNLVKLPAATDADQELLLQEMGVAD